MQSPLISKKLKGDLEKAVSAFNDGLESTGVRSPDPFKTTILVEGIIEILVWKGR